MDGSLFRSEEIDFSAGDISDAMGGKGVEYKLLWSITLGLMGGKFRPCIVLFKGGKSRS